MEKTHRNFCLLILLKLFFAFFVEVSSEEINQNSLKCPNIFSRIGPYGETIEILSTYFAKIVFVFFVEVSSEKINQNSLKC